MRQYLQIMTKRQILFMLGGENLLGGRLFVRTGLRYDNEPVRHSNRSVDLFSRSAAFTPATTMPTLRHKSLVLGPPPTKVLVLPPSL
jgi:hypothetical protein